jgi:hypothetical protein
VGRFLVGMKYWSLLKHLYRLWPAFSLLLKRNREILPRDVERQVLKFEHSLHLVPRLKKCVELYPVPPCTFMMCTTINLILTMMASCEDGNILIGNGRAVCRTDENSFQGRLCPIRVMILLKLIFTSTMI